MIFGFNTDVRCGDTVFHIQSEPRANESLLETQVFVGGRCIGKRSISYAGQAPAGDVGDQQIHEMLREQHRLVVEAARQGHVEEVLSKPGTPPAGQELALEWLNAASVYAGNTMVMRFRVSDGGAAVAGASLTSRIQLPHNPPIYSQGVTDASGTAEMKVSLAEHALHDAAVLVQATHQGRYATRKFRLRRSG